MLRKQHGPKANMTIKITKFKPMHSDSTGEKLLTF